MGTIPRKAQDKDKMAAGTTTWCETGDPLAVEKTLNALREKVLRGTPTVKRPPLILPPMNLKPLMMMMMTTTTEKNQQQRNDHNHRHSSQPTRIQHKRRLKRWPHP